VEQTIYINKIRIRRDRDGIHLQLPVPPMFITANVRTLFMARCTRYNIMW